MGREDTNSVIFFLLEANVFCILEKLRLLYEIQNNFCFLYSDFFCWEWEWEIKKFISKYYRFLLSSPNPEPKFKMFHNFSVVSCQIFITSLQKSFLTLKNGQKLCGEEISKYWKREYWLCAAAWEIPLLVLCQALDLLHSARSGIELGNISAEHSTLEQK